MGDKKKVCGNLQFILLIISALWAIYVLYEQKEEAEKAHTINVLMAVENYGFKKNYRKALCWLKNGNIKQWPDEPETADALQQVFDGYEMIALFSNRELLSEDIVFNSIGQQACQLFNVSKPFLEAHEAFDWWKNFRIFCEEYNHQ